ncbi:NSP-interacting kinase-like protein [Melia azedarach]|uniref:NSP-interacting kinase-like protein n=1 Tax=Melia azedarach TaxID=155640 RepID=A0ACC1Y8J3_MELAZ|nr:NSP-interacting kinase-like protein [Melia azedarach]
MSNGSVASRLKAYVFGFGILILELISGLSALEIGKSTNQKGAVLDWVKKIHGEKQLEIACRGAETTTSRGYDFSNLERYSDMTGSSLKIQAIELSGPW